MKPEQGFSKLIIHPREPEAWRVHGGPEFSGCIFVVPGLRKHETAEIVMRAPIASVSTATSPTLDAVSQCAHGERVARGRKRHPFECRVPGEHPRRVPGR